MESRKGELIAVLLYPSPALLLISSLHNSLLPLLLCRVAYIELRSPQRAALVKAWFENK